MTKTSILSLLLLIVLGMTSACGTEGYGTTKVDPNKDSEDPIKSSGPYSSDASEVTQTIMDQMKKKHVLEDFHARYNDAPICWVIRPKNDTRFPEVTEYFQESLLSALSDKFSRSEMRFVQRDSEVLSEVEKEKLNKESGEYTDRTGRRTKLGSDFFIRAVFSTLSMSDGKNESDSINYSFEFIDTETTEVVFKGSKIIKRVSSKNAVYR